MYSVAVLIQLLAITLVSLFLMPAFHILNDATIQFQLEKIPVERDAELGISVNDDVEISSIMKIEGKFVNPLQVGPQPPWFTYWPT